MTCRLSPYMTPFMDPKYEITHHDRLEVIKDDACHDAQTVPRSGNFNIFSRQFLVFDTISRTIICHWKEKIVIYLHCNCFVEDPSILLYQITLKVFSSFKQVSSLLFITGCIFLYGVLLLFYYCCIVGSNVSFGAFLVSKSFILFLLLFYFFLQCMLCMFLLLYQ